MVGVAVAVGGCGAGVVDAGWGDELGQRCMRADVIKDGNAHVLVPCTQYCSLRHRAGWVLCRC